MVYLASVVSPFNQFKVPPLIPVLLVELNLTEVQAGLLMSVFSISGLVLALPAGLLFQRFGPRLVGTLAVSSTALGSAIGAVSSGAGMLLFGRLIEGVGMGMTAVFALVTIAAWFPPQRRGLPMGIFTTWIPVGQTAMFLIAPRVYEVAGWRGVWWIGSAAAAVCAVLFATLVRLPPGTRMAGQGASWTSFKRVLREPGPWLLAGAFWSFHSSRTGFATWTPTYLVSVAGWTLKDASSALSLFYLVSIPAAIPAGWLFDHVRSKRLLLTSVMLLSIPPFAIAYAIDPQLIVPMMLVAGGLAAIITTAVNASTPLSVSDPTLVGPAAGVVAIGRNSGQLLGPILIAPLIQAGLSWNWVAAVIVAAALLGALASMRLKNV